jgi:hypothetical protein
VAAVDLEPPLTVTLRDGRIERMKSESASTSVPELCAEFAEGVERRESELGHAAANCPSAVELWRVVEIAKQIHAGNEMMAQQANAYLQELEGISDKWLDPETDPVGVHLKPVVEGLIDGLSQELQKAFPDSAEMFRKKADLRKLKQSMQRTIYVRTPKPSRLSRVWKGLSLRRSKSETQGPK